MKSGLTPEETKAIEKIFRQFPQVEEVIIFGSRAMGNFKQASDIDLAVRGNNISLTLIGKIKALLEETITVPYFFDLVDISTTNNTELKKHIEQYGQVFYKKK